MLKKIATTFITLAALSLSAQATVLPSGITYHGRLLQSDGITPVTGVVTFDIQIKSPNSSNCILYEETQTQNLSGSQGVFAITINDGSGTRTDAAPQMSIDDVFSNRTVISHSCSGGPYTPSPGDGRILKVTFQSTTMAQAEPMPDQALNFAPLAIEAKQISGYAAENILRFENADHSLFNTSPLNNTQYDELVHLVNGTSTQYALAPNGASGTSIYASSSGSITSAVVGDMWLDTSAGGNIDVLKINTRSGVQEIPLTATGFITAVTNGTGISVSTTGSTATVSIANGGVTAAKLDPAINITTTGFVSARSLDVSNSLSTPNTVGIAAPAGTFTNYTLVLPTSPGTAGQILKTDGSGNLSWVNGAAGTLTSSHIFVGNASNAATDVAMSGDAKIDNTGAVSVTGLQGVGISTTTPLTGQVLVYNGGISKWQAQNFSIGSLISASGTSQFANASCSSSQTLTWSSLTDTFTCSSISGLDASAIATGTIDPARLPASQWTTHGSNISYDGAGYVGIGTTAPGNPLDVVVNDASTQIILTNASSTAARYPAIAVANYTGATTSAAGALQMRTARGSKVSPAAVTSGDYLGQVSYIGYDGSAFGSGATIQAQISEDWTTTAHGTNMLFRLIAPGTVGTPVEKMRIGGNGTVGIGTTGSSAYKLDVNGAINATALKINGVDISSGGATSLSGLSDTSINYAASSMALGQGTAAGSDGLAAGKDAQASGTFSTALGNNAGHGASGMSSTSVGFYALAGTSSGSDNTAIGAGSLQNLTGSNNTAIGTSTNGVSSGSYNVLLGSSAGGGIGTGSHNIVIGASTSAVTNTSNFLNIGNAIFATGMTGSLAAPAGNVGIGTTAPGSTLHVKNGSSGATTGSGTFTLESNNSVYLQMLSPTNSTDQIRFGDSTDSARGAITYAHSIDRMNFFTSNTLRAVINSTGVGIGTTAPAYALDVNGAVNATALKINGVDITTGGGSSQWTTAGSDISYTTGHVGIGTSTPLQGALDTMALPGDYLTATFEGNSAMSDSLVMISAAGFSGRPALQFHQPGNFDWQVFADGTNSSLYFNPGNSFNSPSANSIVFKKTGFVGIGTALPKSHLDVKGNVAIGAYAAATAAPTNGLIVSGDVGIGTSTPGYPLDVRTTASGYVINAQTNNAASNVVRVQNTNTAGYSEISVFDDAGTYIGGYGYANTGASVIPGQMYVGTLAPKNVVILSNNTERMRITSSGNIGIGTATPAYSLDVNGTIRGFGITDSSDKRLKRDIKPLTDDLEKVSQLQGVSYYWKDTKAHGDKKQIGFIAQEIEKIYPEFVETDAQGMKSVNYSHLVAPVVESIKALDAKLKAKDQQIEELQQQNAAMKEWICTKDPKAKICR